MNIKKNCVGNCTITGDEKNLKYICSKLNKKFSMQSLISVDRNEDMISVWGTEEDIDLITFFYSDFDTHKIELAYKSDVPNTLFLRRLSQAYNLTIRYSYHDPSDKYVGFYKIINGEIVLDEYSETPSSSLYKKLVNTCGFKQKRPKTRIISLGNIFKEAK